jgi:hypothetical protein
MGLDISKTDNKVTLVDNNKSITVTDNNKDISINVTQPITSTAEVSTAGPRGATGDTGPSGPSGSAATSGPDTSVQFRDGITTSGSSDFTFIKATGGVTATSFSGSFSGSGADLINIPASGITGLNLSRIASGNATASISPDKGFIVNTNTQITGSLVVSGSGLSVYGGGIAINDISGSPNPDISLLEYSNNQFRMQSNIGTFFIAGQSNAVSIPDQVVSMYGRGLFVKCIHDGPYKHHFVVNRSGSYSNYQNVSSLIVSGSDHHSTNWYPAMIGMHVVKPYYPLDVSGSTRIMGDLIIAQGGHITASANISSSGFVSASSFWAPPGVINQLTASYAISASVEITKEVSSSYADTASFAQSGTGIFSGSFSGSYEGSGTGLTGIPASGITGLNLSRIASGSATASISPDKGFIINTDTQITGSVIISGSQGLSIIGGGLLIDDIVGGADFTLIENTPNGFVMSTSGGIGTFLTVGPSNMVTMPNQRIRMEGRGVHIQGTWDSAGQYSHLVVNRSGSHAGYDPENVSSLVVSGAASTLSDWEPAFVGINVVSPQYQLDVNGNTRIIGNLIVSASGHITASGNISSSGTYYGDGSNLTGISAFPFTGSAEISGSLSVDGTSRTLFTSCSLVYSGSNVTQVTQSFTAGTTQITNILYSGSFADGNPLSVAITGSDGVNKLYTLTYSASLVTEILVT